MFSDAIITTLCAIVNADDTASRVEKEQLSEIIVSFASNGIGSKDVGRVVTFADAAKLLGRRNAQKARNLAKRGRLKSVYGTGTRRAIGVTLQSLNEFIESGGR